MNLLRLGFVIALINSAVSAKEIAFSFDDAPLWDGNYFTGQMRAPALIRQLKNGGVEQAVFYCTTERANQEGRRRLLAYAHAGHLLGNHTHTHLDFSNTDSQKYLKDVIKADSILRSFPNFRPFFRFPFLHEGDTIEKRDYLRSALKKLGYRAGYVTVDSYDFYMDKLFQDALASGKTVNFPKLGEVYAKVLSESVEFYNDIGVRVLGHSPKHVILLHENDIAALFVGNLVAKLRQTGWSIITAEEAYTDPISETEPNTLFLGQGRVAAIAKEKGDKGPFWKWEEEADLEKLFAEYAVFK